MRYKVTHHQGNIYFFESKQELFCFFDDLIEYNHSLTSVFSDRFEKTFGTGSYFSGFKAVSEERESYYYNHNICIYVNALYKIQDNHSYAVDYEILFSEYKQSRGIKKDVRKYFFSRKDRSTKKYRRSSMYHYIKRSHTSRKNEYASLLGCEETDVKIRAKRLSLLHSMNINYYLDEESLRTCEKSWKSNKKMKRQWQKRQQ